jgi:hypothetical protein
MQKLRIGDISIGITTTNTDLPRRLGFFSTLEEEEPNFKIQLKSSNYIPKPRGEMVIDEGVKWLSSLGKNDTIAYMCNEESDEVVSVMEIDEAWTNASVNYLENVANGQYSFTGLIGEILFRNLIIKYQGIQIHSAAIECEGKGIIFSAPSGTGKTTQANLWRLYKNAEIINGDRPIVCTHDNQPYVYGTPWSATSPDFANKKVPLTAIIMLAQAPENNIRQLSKKEAINWLMPRCFLPYHDKSLMELAISNIDRIITLIPVYLLECRPDKAAMELVYECVK